jgi:ABC-type multidrug transport system permease subunit
MQGIISFLLLTALNKALRMIMNDGSGFLAVLPSLGILLLWMVVSFVLATRLFRWR